MTALKQIWVVVGALTVASTTSASEWTHWRGPFQTGVSPDGNLPAKLRLDPKAPDTNLIWKAPYGCRSTPIVMNGRVYIINNVGTGETEQERVMCFDATNGKVLWEYKFNVWHTGIVSARLGWTNLAADPKTESIFAHGTQGLLLCFGKDGKVVWQRSLSEEFGRISGYGGRLCSPIVADDLVIIGMNNSSWGDQKGGTRWVAMQKDTGTVVWWAEPGGPPTESFYCVPAVAVIGGQKLLITGSSEGGVYAMKVATGEKVWGYRLGTTMINSSPVVDGDFVYIGHGDENFDNGSQGRIVCLDAGTVKDGKPREVWKEDGVKARYASPIIAEGRVYFPDDIGTLYCRDAKTGKKHWNYTYGRDARGSPVLADGKIYVGEVGSKFHILQPGAKKCKALDEVEFFSADGKTEIEVNGTPAIANGRLYFTTSEEIYCVGEKEAKSVIVQPPGPILAPVASTEPAHLQLIPAEVTLHPGESVTFQARFFNEFGKLLGERQVKAEWSLPEPPVPPGAKNKPPALKGSLAGGALTLDAKVPSQQGYVQAKAEGLVARARVRVAPRLPYSQDFEKISDGAVPGGWVNTQGKFLVKTLKDGSKVLAKVTDKSSPMVARGNAYIGLPTDKDYTIECDVQGGRAGTDLPDMGIIANRYTLFLSGNIQKLRLNSWEALPRVDKTIPFRWEPGVWYRLKLTVDVNNGSAIARGKCWQKDTPEPEVWTVEVNDSRPIGEGAPGLYAYVIGHPPQGGSGTDVFFDNVRITPNKK